MPAPPSTVAGNQILEFLDVFAAAIEVGDTPFLLESLHPLVVQQFSPELCQSFIEQEILTFANYRATGAVVGPEERTLLGTRIADFYEVPVSFGFQGRAVESIATFATVDGRVLWFAECR